MADKVKLIVSYYQDSLRKPAVRAAAEEYGMDVTSNPNIVALFARLRSHFRYLPDPVGAELIKAPWVQVSEIGQRGYTVGDCDDAASLSYTMLHMAGIPAKLAVGWYGEADPRHIWAVIPTSEGMLPFDLCARALGESKPGATDIQYYG